MRTQLTNVRAYCIRPLFTATLAFAITLTLSCSGGDDGGNEPSSGSVAAISSSSDGGGTPIENTQLYKKDGTLYTGSGVIKIRAKCIENDGGANWTLINAGNVTNGKVELRLPTTIPAEYLGELLSEELQQRYACTDYPTDIKGLRDACGKSLLALVNSNLSEDYINSDNTSESDYIGKLDIMDEQVSQGIAYWYFSKPAKIICNDSKTNINATAGWNNIYGNGIEDNTDNILTNEVRWTLR
jgi:hypothetical protein